MAHARARFLTGAAVVLATAAVPCLAGGMQVSHLFQLSDFSGPVPYSAVRVFSDPYADEVYVAEGNDVRVFNPSGMEIYAFRVEPGHGNLASLAVDETGDILMLTTPGSRDQADGPAIWRCDYRGEPKSRVPIRELSPAFSTLRPATMSYVDGRFYVTDAKRHWVVVLDRNGVFQKGYDLDTMLDFEDRDSAGIEGFSIDPRGDLLLTVPLLYRAFVVSPDGEIRSFGKPGSRPGSFSVVSAIAGDAAGNYYVADKQRSVVMAFDRNFRFLTEFGHWGDGPGNLVRPIGLVAGPSNKLYVTQRAKRGVSVFSVNPGSPE